MRGVEVHHRSGEPGLVGSADAAVAVRRRGGTRPSFCRGSWGQECGREKRYSWVQHKTAAARLLWFYLSFTQQHWTYNCHWLYLGFGLFFPSAALCATDWNNQWIYQWLTGRQQHWWPRFSCFHSCTELWVFHWNYPESVVFFCLFIMFLFLCILYNHNFLLLFTFILLIARLYLNPNDSFMHCCLPLNGPHMEILWFPLNLSINQLPECCSILTWTLCLHSD